MIATSFREKFGASPAHLASAPGRVNLIGEHIDYNGGIVLPAALSISLSIALRPRDDRTIRIASDRFDGVVERSLDTSKQGDWADYAASAIQIAVAEGLLSNGAELLVESTIPDGAGLSSSAALIVAILKAASENAQRDIYDKDIAKLAQRVENDYIGVPCGIMDQMAVALAQPGQAIALDTKSLDYDIIELPKDWAMAVVHSGEQRQLSDGRYAVRKAECDEAKAILYTSDLCLLNHEELERVDALPTNLQRRVFHCIDEHRRTVAAADALRIQDMHAFGALMNKSHVSMRDNFEMTTPEIDALVASAVKFGAVGARLTGGGFGGCIIAFVEANKLDEWKVALLAKHPKATFIC